MLIKYLVQLETWVPCNSYVSGKFFGVWRPTELSFSPGFSRPP